MTREVKNLRSINDGRSGIDSHHVHNIDPDDRNIFAEPVGTAGKRLVSGV